MDDEFADDVRTHGWSAVAINDGEPPFLYTVGLMYSFDHPELVMFGLESDNAHALFAGLVRDLRSGRSHAEPGVRTIRLGDEDYQVGFRRVHPTQHPLYLGYAMGFARSIGRTDELSVVQAFWPDRAGKFPFDLGCESGVSRLQPRLDVGLTPTEVRQYERQWE